MYASSVIARGRAALQGSETEQRIAVLLYDDSVQVISSFELNQLASLTYHDTANGVVISTGTQDMSEILLDHLEQIQSQPVNYSVITVQKSLVVTKHILLHGAEKVVPCIKQQLGRYVETLCQYNTVLAAQQQQTTGAWFMRLKGGGVDTAGPVREVALQIHNLLVGNGSPQQLQFERSAAADPNSLVPIGSRQQIAFCSDEVRLEQLRKRMQEQQTIMTRSNLAKASDGFGSGYMAANGKTVVGAAHGIEEMLKQQQKEEQRFSDANSNTNANTAARNINSSSAGADAFSFSEYQAPNLYEYAAATATSQDQHYHHHQQQQQQEQHEQQPDLLAMGSSCGSVPSMMRASGAPSSATATSTATADLLDFGTSISYQPQLHHQTQQEDLLFGSDATATLPTSTDNIFTATTTTTDDPFQLVSAPVSSIVSSPTPSALSSPFAVSNLLQNMSLGSNNTASVSAPNVSVSAKPFSVMSSKEDRFSALDALSSGSGASMSLKSTTMTTSSFAGLGSFATASIPPPTAAASSSAQGDLSGLTETTETTTTAAPSVLSMMHPQQQQQQSMAFALPVSLSSIKVSQPLGNDSENSGGGFLMGGSQGAGLEPLGEAPAAPPPPPGSFYY